MTISSGAQFGYRYEYSPTGNPQTIGSWKGNKNLDLVRASIRFQVLNKNGKKTNSSVTVYGITPN